MSLRILSLGAALLASACSSQAAPPRAASGSADLEAWLDRTEDRGPARSTTLRGPIAMPEAEAPPRSWGTRTIHARVAEPPRPRRRAPVDVSFHRSDMANAFQFLADAGRFNLVMQDGLTGQVSATLHGVDPYDALKAMAEANGVDVRYDGQVVVVAKKR